MNQPRLLSLSIILVLAVCASAQAEWGWKPKMPSMPALPNLNPFKKRDSHPANFGQEQSSWQLPGTRKSADPQESKPSMWQRVSSGTKSGWAKTKSVLTPWRAKPQPEEELVITGSNSSFSRMANSNNKQPAKKAFWAWGNEEDDERPQQASSVSEFIGGRRPE